MVENRLTVKPQCTS